MVQSNVQVDMTGEVQSTASTHSDNSSSNKPTAGKSSRSNKKTHSKTTESGKTAKTNDTDIEDGKAKTITVTDLSVYEGENLLEQLDSFIKAHPVVMFNRSWCLFSVDAIEFMVGQLQVSVYSLEVDTHPQGKDILKYITKKTGQKTTPLIFIRGEFLGGFDQVNSLYATGELQRDYLYGLSQADQCEEFINKANLTKKPLFWFPETVNAYVIQISGVLTCMTATVAAISVWWFSWGVYIAYGLAGDFFLRILAGTCLSPLGRIACLIAKCIGNKPRVGRPKQFASCLGFTCALLGSIFYALPFYACNAVGSVFMGMLALATGMEGFLDFCLGCFIFKWGVKVGIISK